MSYTKQNFKNGQKLMAEELNKMDTALEKVTNQFPTLSSQDFGKQLYVNETGDGFMLLGNGETIKWNLLEKAEGYRPGYVDGTDIDENGVQWQASSFITYFNIPVTAGTTYYLGGPENKNQYRARFVNWQKEPYILDAEYKITMTNAEIKAATISTRGPQTAENQVAPTGAKYCTISFYDMSQAGTETNYLTTISKAEDRVDIYKSTDLVVASSGKWNMLTEEGVRSGNIYINGTAGTTGGFYTVYNLPVKSGEKYYIGPAFNGQYARFVNWTKSPYLLNEDGSVAMSSDEIKAVTLATVGATRQEEHTAAIGAQYCTVSFYVNYGGITKEDCYFTTIKNIDERIDGSPTYVVNNKGVSQEVIDQIDTNTDNIESLSTVSNNLREYDFVQKTRRAIVNFQFDDAILEGDTICKEIFDDFGYKCDFAVTSGIVNNADKMKAYLGFQNEGFHILSHSTDGNSMDSYEDEADKQLKINNPNSYSISPILQPASKHHPLL